MAQIIESIPNISEGRRTDVIEACVDQIRTTPGCTLLNYSSDESHNRTVITYIGDAKGVEEASVKLVKKAAELIDLTKHEGEHPRMGAVDVMPFLAIKDCTTEDCVELSKAVGARIADEAGVPVFLYEYSAQRPERQNLVKIRKGQFEGMAEKVQEPDWEPDFGGRKVHPTAGVMAVGARPPLVAYNLNLNTDDVQVAKNIANVIREKDGGLKCVKAMGFEIEDEVTGKKYAQVSINMTNYEQTPLYRVTEMVKSEAARYGVVVTGTEIIGLCPMKALVDSAEYYLQIKDFDFHTQVLENHIL
ncbi:glutamate formimidoyltransferase [Anaerotruncus sp. 80]|uniref:glutamate formimidoyltransferase n=1 Tax=Anaerotruncus colihominis TaxID=169435 RepID=A0A845QFP5_9FIRM|nr:MULTISPECIES: glutamate formimidoyltransferase [Anaerotruncus]NBH60772.1 glutamate formimidoyltransferase [Anaerotruncus colihominis]NCF01426.1 glutamate formimidoyltransferase [Anaerotruncus sp. 80]